MFWQKYTALCSSVNKSPNAVAEELGVKSSGTVTGWKKGAKPRESVILAICNYFGLPLEYFDEEDWDAYQNGTIGARQDLMDSPGRRVLFDALPGATEADLLEAAALITRRKEERNKQ